MKEYGITILSLVLTMNDTIIICFAGVGRDRKKPPGEEFRGIKQWNHVDSIHFIDHQRSFFNNVNVDELKEKTSGYKKVIALGNSLGAYNANCFAQVAKVDAVISFAAVYSVSARVIPWVKENWPQFVYYGTDWQFTELKFNDTTQYHFYQGDEYYELKHLDLIPDAPNIYKTIIPNTGHSVARKLLKEKKLYPMIEEIINEI